VYSAVFRKQIDMNVFGVENPVYCLAVRGVLDSFDDPEETTIVALRELELEVLPLSGCGINWDNYPLTVSRGLDNGRRALVLRVRDTEWFGRQTVVVSSITNGGRGLWAEHQFYVEREKRSWRISRVELLRSE
jgi:hypothetical protein